MHHAEAIVLTDSMSEEGYRLTTFQLRYWRAIHSEVMTHRVFARNAGSSRARPSAAIIKQVRTDPWGPLHWGANQPGMQAHQEIEQIENAKNHWYDAAVHAADQAGLMLEQGLHKQIVNRVLEPFTYIDVVLSSTDFENFFQLRDHPDAQPEIQDLAKRMRKAYDESTPNTVLVGEWHLPYITDQDWDMASDFLDGYVSPVRELQVGSVLELLKRASTARCARVSYKPYDAVAPDFAKDLALYAKLVGSDPKHASPTEHVATPDYLIADDDEWLNPTHHGCFVGWNQHRKELIEGYYPF